MSLGGTEVTVTFDWKTQHFPNNLWSKLTYGRGCCSEIIRNYCSTHFWHEFLHNAKMESGSFRNNLSGDVKRAAGSVGLSPQAPISSGSGAPSVGEHAYNLMATQGCNPSCGLLVVIYRPHILQGRQGFSQLWEVWGHKAKNTVNTECLWGVWQAG